MKKLLYIMLFALASGAIMTSCTEEEIAPAQESSSNGGGPIDPR